jgi:hypothetical protein
MASGSKLASEVIIFSHWIVCFALLYGDTVRLESAGTKIRTGVAGLVS